MKTKLVLGAVAAAVAVFSQGAFAQAASSPSRADVKAQTKAAEKSGQLAPAGEAGDLKGTQPGKGSQVDKAQRKADTKAANKAGKLTPAGEAAGPSTDKPMK